MENELVHIAKNTLLDRKTIINHGAVSTIIRIFKMMRRTDGDEKDERPSHLILRNIYEIYEKLKK